MECGSSEKNGSRKRRPTEDNFTVMECGSSEKNGSRKRQSTEDNYRSAMLDLELFNCPICVEPLTTPIFQCVNGHIACSSCCPKLNNKCPLCASFVGHIRCRAMETLLDTIFVPCRNATFGCTKKFTYGKESVHHEEECLFSPCSCPVQDCDYTCSYKDLCDHYTLTHLETDMQRYRPLDIFSCSTPFYVWMNISEKKIIQREFKKSEKILFAVQCFRKPYGVYVTVSCIAPSSPEVRDFSYHLSYTTTDGHTVSYKSPQVKRIREVSFQTPKENFMFIPHGLLGGEILKILVCINDRVVEPSVKNMF